jgi:hypothetical protein
MAFFSQNEGVTVEVRGPVFDNMRPIIKKITKEFMQQMVEKGEQRLDERLRPRPRGVYLSMFQAQKGKGSTGNYRRNVSGRVETPFGEVKGVLTDGGVIYGPWLEGTSSRNMTTRFKGYASFRKVAKWLDFRIAIEGKKLEAMLAKRFNR